MLAHLGEELLNEWQCAAEATNFRHNSVHNIYWDHMQFPLHTSVYLSIIFTPMISDGRLYTDICLQRTLQYSQQYLIHASQASFC